MNNVSEGFVMRPVNRGVRLASDTTFGQVGCNDCREGTDRTKYNSRLIKGPQAISPEERWQAIAVMAYHLAKARGFVGEAVEYWLAAEAKVDAELAVQQSAM